MVAGGKLLLRFLLLQSFVLGVLCCTCIYTHPQRQFCQHEYVMKVRIKVPDKGSSRHEIKSQIEIRELFKGDVNKLNFIKDRDIHMRMPRNCALDFMKAGDDFLIFGDLFEGSIYSHLCNGNVYWNSISETLQRGFSCDLKYGCHCLHKRHQVNSCHCKYSYIKRSCSWFWSSELANCKNEKIICEI